MGRAQEGGHWRHRIGHTTCSALYTLQCTIVHNYVHCTAPHNTALPCTSVRYSELHQTALHFTAVNFVTLHFLAVYCRGSLWEGGGRGSTEATLQKEDGGAMKPLHRRRYLCRQENYKVRVFIKVKIPPQMFETKQEE